MNDSTTLKTKKPDNWFNQKIEIDFKKLFITVAKGVISTIKGDSLELTRDLSEGFEAFSGKKEPESLAYNLLFKAMINSAYNLTIENRTNLERKYEVILEKDPDFSDFSKEMKEVAKEVTISRDFFKNPQSISLLPEFTDAYRRFLLYFEIEEHNIQNIINRLPSYFIMALNEEWGKNSSTYETILKSLDTPFTDAAKRELEWQRYYSFLEKQINEPVFEETFGLKQIFIPLRGYYKKKNDKTEISAIHDNKDKVELIPFYVEEELNKWLNTTDSSQTIKLISGGPGSGKSSLSKIWSADVAESQKIKILFIPLHLFDIQGDIEESVEKFVRQNADINFSFNPLQLTDGKLLIVFDGLDELSERGKYATEVATNFIDNLQKYSNLKNRDTAIKVLFLITGRELAIQANSHQFRKFDQTIFLLPYYIAKNRNTESFRTHIELSFTEKYDNIIKIDQRDLWWKKFGNLKNKPYKFLPSELELPRLDEITAQPLLNYLVALSYERAKVSFDDNTNLNDVYKDLIEGVYERAYESRPHKQIDGLSKEHFIRILQEIAISAWHGGDSRTTSIKDIEEHIKQNNLKSLMDKFQDEAKKGILRLLTAFYFREHSGVTSDGDKTFEFTHKSFGEYLIATRLVHQLSHISKKLEENDIDDGWNESKALANWMPMASQTAIDEYLFEFIKDEIKSKPIDEVEVWQTNLAKLLSYMLFHGMPMPEPRESHKKEVTKARNASEALLVLHSACAYHTDKISRIDAPEIISFSAWFSSLQPQRSGNNTAIGFLCLNHINLSEYIFFAADLYEANLYKAILVNSGFILANLQRANLQGADLRMANLQSADLRMANLQGANLKGADFKDADFKDADLKDADFEMAKLEKTKLENTKGLNIIQKIKYSTEQIQKIFLQD